MSVAYIVIIGELFFGGNRVKNRGYHFHYFYYIFVLGCISVDTRG